MKLKDEPRVPKKMTRYSNPATFKNVDFEMTVKLAESVTQVVYHYRYPSPGGDTRQTLHGLNITVLRQQTYNINTICTMYRQDENHFSKRLQ